MKRIINIYWIAGIALMCLSWHTMAANESVEPGTREAKSPEIERILKEDPGTLWNDSESKTSRQDDPGKLLRQFATSIGLVLLLGAAAYFLSRKFGARLTMPRGRHIRVIESIALGTNRQIHLVEVGRRRILVGSSPQSIRLIADVGEDGEPMEVKQG